MQTLDRNNFQRLRQITVLLHFKIANTRFAQLQSIQT